MPGLLLLTKALVDIGIDTEIMPAAGSAELFAANTSERLFISMSPRLAAVAGSGTMA